MKTKQYEKKEIEINNTRIHFNKDGLSTVSVFRKDQHSKFIFSNPERFKEFISDCKKACELIEGEEIKQRIPELTQEEKEAAKELIKEIWNELEKELTTNEKN